MTIRRFLTTAAMMAATASAVSAAPPDQGIAVMSAMVTTAGALDTGSSGATAAGKTSTGVYFVDFARDISTCTFVSSASNHTTSVWTQVSTSTARSADNRQRLVVGTYYNNLSDDRPFGLIVFCPK